MPEKWTQTSYLSILTHAPAQAVKQLAEATLPQLGSITVLKNQTGLVMLPYTDSGNGTVFHLGEVLVAEAHIHTEDKTEGYGMVLGRDVEFAMAVAVLDAALSSQSSAIDTAPIYNFLEAQQQAQADADRELLKKIEATRVEMETF